MKDFLIRLLGGKTQKEYQEIIQNLALEQELSYISRSKLDFASTLLKRWSEHRHNINSLVYEIHKATPNYFFDNKNNQSLFFELVLQDYYFRRLYLLRYGQDFYEHISEEKEDCFYSKETGSILPKAFWEIEPKYLDLIYSNNFIKNWNK